MDGIWALTKRNVTQAARTGVMGPGAMMIKYAYSELRQRLGELSMKILERDVLAVDAVGEFVEERLRTLALTIAAGTSQIQKNIIGERVLGLPKEPRP
jgi:alkylation response protein AidB-like acyl-CoA dehydrogenase